MDESLKRQVRIMKKRREEMGFMQTDVAEEAGMDTLHQKPTCFYFFLPSQEWLCATK